MQNNKDDQKSKNPIPGMGEKSGPKAGSTSNKRSDPDMQDDEVTSAGGREGNFSDKNRGSEGQWSPGSSGASDQ